MYQASPTKAIPVMPPTPMVFPSMSPATRLLLGYIMRGRGIRAMGTIRAFVPPPLLAEAAATAAPLAEAPAMAAVVAASH